MNPILDRILSGRFLFTVISALVFAYLAIKGMLPQDKVTEIILIVVYAYFNKPNQPTSTPPATPTT